jgi:hypothetical protein
MTMMSVAVTATMMMMNYVDDDNVDCVCLQRT